MKYTFNVDVLDGDATVAVNVAITTQVLGSAPDTNKKLAREEAERFIVEACRRAIQAAKE